MFELASELYFTFFGDARFQLHRKTSSMCHRSRVFNRCGSGFEKPDIVWGAINCGCSCHAQCHLDPQSRKRLLQNIADNLTPKTGLIYVAKKFHKKDADPLYGFRWHADCSNYSVYLHRYATCVKSCIWSGRSGTFSIEASSYLYIQASWDMHGDRL